MAKDIIIEPEPIVVPKTPDCVSNKAEFIFKIPTKPAPKTNTKKLAEKLQIQESINQVISKDAEIVRIPRDRLEDPPSKKPILSSRKRPFHRNRNPITTTGRILRDPGPSYPRKAFIARTHTPRYPRNTTYKFSNNYSNAYQFTHNRPRLSPDPRHTYKSNFKPNQQTVNRPDFRRLRTPLPNRQPFHPSPVKTFHAVRHTYGKGTRGSFNFNQPGRNLSGFYNSVERENSNSTNRHNYRNNSSASGDMYASSMSRFRNQNARRGSTSHYGQQRNAPTFCHNVSRSPRGYRY